MTPAQRWREPDPLELREEVEEVVREQAVRGVGLLVRRVDAAREVVVRVVAAEEHPIVERPSVVVELVAGVGQSLAALPADRVELRRRQGLGHEDVVVDREHPRTEPLEHALRRVRADHDAPRMDRARVQRHADAVALGVESRGARVLVEPDAERLGGPGQPPDEAGRVDEGDVGVVHPGQVARRVDARPRLHGVEQLHRHPVSPMQLVGLAHGRDLVLGQRERQLAGDVEVGVDRRMP